MQKEAVVIDWNYRGKPNITMGTGAVPAEKAIGWVATFIIPLLYVYFYITGYLAWNWWHYALAILLGADLGGGMVCNALNSCKRFYFSPLKADEKGFVRIVKIGRASCRERV